MAAGVTLPSRVSSSNTCRTASKYSSISSSRFFRNALSGKRFGFIIVYGASDPFSAGAITAMRCFHDTFARKASWMRTVHGSTPRLGDTAKNGDLTKQAADLGRELVAQAH